MFRLHSTGPRSIRCTASFHTFTYIVRSPWPFHAPAHHACFDVFAAECLHLPATASCPAQPVYKQAAHTSCHQLAGRRSIYHSIFDIYQQLALCSYRYRLQHDVAPLLGVLLGIPFPHHRHELAVVDPPVLRHAPNDSNNRPISRPTSSSFRIHAAKQPVTYVVGVDLRDDFLDVPAVQEPLLLERLLQLLLGDAPAIAKKPQDETY